MKETINIAVFASGAGSNAKKLLENLPAYLESGSKVCNAVINIIITDNPNAGVIDIAKEYNVRSEVISLAGKNEEEKAETFLSVLSKHKISFIILAGFLKKIPAPVIKAFPQMIINIHPALLPAYGGAGMYGMRVHNAVIQAGEKETGITIHYVDEIYDNGEIIFRAKCEIDKDDNAESIAAKVHSLEHAHYSRVAAQVLQSQKCR